MALAPTPTSPSAERARAGWWLAAGLGLALALVSVRLRVAEQAARTDPLTGLWNRRGLAHAWSARAAGPEILFLDLCGFKAVNDRLGHDVGDRLLRAVARRLARGLEPGERIGRWGGDEFVLLTGDAASARRRVAHALARPFRIAGAGGRIVLALGVAQGQARAAAGLPLDRAVADAARALR